VANLQDAPAVGTTLLKLLRQYRQYYLELKRLADQQRALIQAEQSEELLKLLAKRQKIVEAIGRVHQQMAPYQQGWDELKDQLDEPCRTELQNLLTEVESMLTGLLDHDRRDCQDLSARKQKIAGQLTGATKGRAATRAYGGEVGSGEGSRRSGTGFETSG